MIKIRSGLFLFTVQIVAISFLLTPALSLAQGGVAATLGKAEYNTSCASCHGPEGTGDGPVAAQLTIKPANLQMISKNNGGVFPTEKVYMIIDGRETVRAHGTSEMPVWGDTYSGYVKGSMGGSRDDPQSIVVEQAVTGRILSLLYYLQSIQAN